MTDKPENTFSSLGLLIRANDGKAKKFKYAKTEFSTKQNRSPSPDVGHLYGKVSNSEIPKLQQKGLIIILPKRRKLQRSEQLTFAAWCVSHALYWLHFLSILPSAAVLPLQSPPWSYKRYSTPSRIKDFHIEPDWSS
ncbi:uncharacterized protein LOC132701287 [Cylas formicarius]|uniref:uncharacterized protein LOC132701287 n=1 Tax=Cylas formicarius TaxID=197179 RepID=UPI002958B1ED|nr:uncharacterized protein LOC132701287 [Cylas formicarius]